MATIAALTENFQGGTDGADVTTSNSIFDNASSPFPVFTTDSIESTLAMRNSGTGSSVVEANFTAVTTLWVSFYLKLTANATSDTAIFNAWGDSAANKILDVRVGAGTSTLELRSVSTNRWTSTALALNEWHRIAVGITPVDSVIRLKIYSGANLHSASTTSQDSGNQSNTNTTATNCDEIRFGLISADTTLNYRIDRIRGDDATEPAPIASGSTITGVAAASFGGTYTASGVPATLGFANASFGGGTFAASGDLKILGVAAKAFGGSFVAAGSTNLSVPTGLAANWVTPTRIDLTWNAVTSAVGYDIERNGVVIKFDHATNSYSDTGLTQQTSYSYRVRSVG